MYVCMYMYICTYTYITATAHPRLPQARLTGSVEHLDSGQFTMAPRMSTMVCACLRYKYHVTIRCHIRCTLHARV